MNVAEKVLFTLMPLPKTSRVDKVHNNDKTLSLKKS